MDRYSAVLKEKNFCKDSTISPSIDRFLMKLSVLQDFHINVFKGNLLSFLVGNNY